MTATGAAKETPPVELIRQAQDVMAVRLLVDLYFAQNLREDGGISGQHLSKGYQRRKVGQSGPHAVWSFAEVHTSVNWSPMLLPHRREKLTEEELAAGKNPGVDFFPRLGLLERLHLLDWVPCLFESDSHDAELIHACFSGDTDALEDRMGAAGREAANRLLTEGQRDWLASVGAPIVVPVLDHIASVAVLGVARLRYRPRTKLTAAWWAELQTKGEKWIATYEAIGRSEPLGILNECANL